MRSAALLLALAACSDDAGPRLPDAALAADANPAIDAAPARETIMELQNLPPGEVAEGIMTGASSDAALIHLAAPMQLDWNIHTHMSDRTINIYEEYGKTAVDYTFVPPTSGEWYLLVRNSGNVTADIQVTVRLYGAMTWRWQ